MGDDSTHLPPRAKSLGQASTTWPWAHSHLSGAEAISILEVEEASVVRVPSRAERQQQELVDNVGSKFRVTFPDGMTKQEPACFQCMAW